MACQDSLMELPGGPVAEQAAGVEQTFEQANDAVVVQFDTGDAALAGNHRGSQFSQCSGIHSGFEEFRLLFEVAVGVHR